MKKNRLETNLGGGTGIYSILYTTVYYNTTILVIILVYLTSTTQNRIVLMRLGKTALPHICGHNKYWYSTVFTHTLQCFFNFCTLISVVLCLQI